MKANKKAPLLTKKQIAEAKAALATIRTLRDKLEPMESIEDLDGHTNGIAYEAHDAYWCFSDELGRLETALEQIENFNK